MARFKDADGWELLFADPATNSSTWRYFDGEREHFKTCMDVTQALADNAEIRHSTAGERWGDYRRVASIPADVYWQKFAEADRIGDQKHVKKLLNDSDNAKFRTFEGRV